MFLGALKMKGANKTELSRVERREILKRILGGEVWPPVKEGNDEQS